LGSLEHSPDSLAEFKGPTSKGREGRKDRREGQGRRKGRGGEGKRTSEFQICHYTTAHSIRNSESPNQVPHFVTGARSQFTM